MANTAAINIDADIKDLTDSLKQMTAAFKSENDAIQMQFQTSNAALEKLERTISRDVVSINNMTRAWVRLGNAQNQNLVTINKSILDQTRVMQKGFNDLTKSVRDLAAEMKTVVKEFREMATTAANSCGEAERGVARVRKEMTLLEKATKYLAWTFQRAFMFTIVASTGAAFKNVGKEGRAFEQTVSKLTSVTGDLQKSMSLFQQINNMAREVPYTVDEMTQSILTLNKSGFAPSKDNLMSIAKIAAGTGKNMTEISSAISGLVQGNYRGLRQLGVTVKDNGETMIMTYKGATTEVKKNTDAVMKYIKSIADNDYAQTLNYQMDGLTGKTKKLSEAWGDFSRSLYFAGGQQFLGNFYSGLTRLLDTISQWLSKDEVIKAIQKALDAFDGFCLFVKSSVQGLGTIVGSFWDLFTGTADSSSSSGINFLGSFFDYAKAGFYAMAVTVKALARTIAGLIGQFDKLTSRVASGASEQDRFEDRQKLLMNQSTVNEILRNSPNLYDAIRNKNTKAIERMSKEEKQMYDAYIEARNTDIKDNPVLGWGIDFLKGIDKGTSTLRERWMRQSDDVTYYFIEGLDNIQSKLDAYEKAKGSFGKKLVDKIAGDESEVLKTIAENRNRIQKAYSPKGVYKDTDTEGNFVDPWLNEWQKSMDLFAKTEIAADKAAEAAIKRRKALEDKFNSATGGINFDNKPKTKGPGKGGGRSSAGQKERDTWTPYFESLLNQQVKFNNDVERVEAQHLKELAELDKKYQENKTASIEQYNQARNILETKYQEERKKMQEQANSALEQLNMVDPMLANLEIKYNRQLELLQAYHDQEYISEEQHQEALRRLKENYDQNKTVKSYELWEKQFKKAHETDYKIIDGVNKISSAFSNLTSSLDKNSGAYKVVFAMQKSFAIASATANAILAWTKALSSPDNVTWYQSLANYMSAVALTTQIIAQLSSLTMHDNGGNIPSGGLGIVGEYGPEIVRGPASITSRKDTEELLKGNKGSNVTVNLIEDNNKAGQVNQSQNDRQTIIDVFVSNIRQGGEMADSIESTYGLQRRGY